MRLRVTLLSYALRVPSETATISKRAARSCCRERAAQAATRGGSGSRCAGVRSPDARRAAGESSQGVRRRERVRVQHVDAPRAQKPCELHRTDQLVRAPDVAERDLVAEAAHTVDERPARGDTNSTSSPRERRASANRSETSCPPAMSPPITSCATFTRGKPRRARSRRPSHRARSRSRPARRPPWRTCP